MGSVFQEFLGQEVKAPYRDGPHLKVARGKLEAIDDGFVKVVDKLGTLVINERNIQKMSAAKKGAA